MSGAHFKVVGRCGHVISQCKCIGPKDVRVVEELCPSCSTPAPGIPLSEAAGPGPRVEHVQGYQMLDGGLRPLEDFDHGDD